MRIIGGKFRGRKIQHPGTGTVRPTKDRIREAVFNIIAERVSGAKVLDIFAGSGAYGLEAISRGAKETVFIENNRRCAGVIKENIASLGIEDQARVIVADAFGSAELLEENKEGFDLVFSDPPYKRDMAKKTLIMINQYDILNPSGFLIIEHHVIEDLPEIEGNLTLCRKKTYGDASISIYSKK